MNVVAIDFGQRAVIPRLIIATQHEPVVASTGPHVFVRHRRIVFGRPRHGQTDRSGRCGDFLGLRIRKRGKVIGGLAIGDITDHDRARRGQRFLSWLGAVGAQHKRGEVDVGLLSETARHARRQRHCNAEVGDQLTDRALVPNAHERRSDQGAGFVDAAQIASMAGRAMQCVRRESRCSLRLRECACLCMRGRAHRCEEAENC